MTTISLEGLASNLEHEERALAYIKVEHNGQTYNWQMYVPPDAGLSAYIESSTARIGAEIDAKEAEWVTAPKTREVEDPMTGETTTVPVQKEEIVRPEIPDYYAKRRAEYPSLAEQIGAMWKGGEAAIEMAAKVQAVKDKHPKP